MQVDQLNRTFAALSDPTRRAILARLTEGDALLKDLAEPFDMTLAAVGKHLKVLEEAGLVVRGRDKQKRPCRLDTRPLQAASAWLETYKALWEERFDRLDDYLDTLQSHNPDHEQ